MGLFGAGLGTSVAQFAGALFCIWLLFANVTSIKLKFKGLKIDFGIIVSVFKLGVPASLQLVAISLASMGLAANANIFGVKILTTYILGLRVDLLISMSIFAVGAAMEIISGQNMGANKQDRIFAYHKSAMKQLGILMFILGTIAFIFGNKVALIFTNDLIIQREVGRYLQIVAYSYIPLSIGIVSIRTISGAGDYKRSLAIVASIVLGFQLSLAYGLSNIVDHQTGIWVAMLLTTIVFAIVGLKQVYGKKWIEAKV
jgi:Na+-driven multidrug efflux pump